MPMKVVLACLTGNGTVLPFGPADARTMGALQWMK